jgi:hypothetical protein
VDESERRGLPVHLLIKKRTEMGWMDRLDRWIDRRGKRRRSRSETYMV